MQLRIKNLSLHNKSLDKLLEYVDLMNAELSGCRWNGERWIQNPVTSSNKGKVDECIGNTHNAGIRLSNQRVIPTRSKAALHDFK